MASKVGFVLGLLLGILCLGVGFFALANIYGIISVASNVIDYGNVWPWVIVLALGAFFLFLAIRELRLAKKKAV